MKKLGSLPVGLSFAGCFLGVGCMSGAEVFQFFGTFGIPGFVGVFFAVTGLALLNLAIAYIVGKTAMPVLTGWWSAHRGKCFYP